MTKPIINKLQDKKLINRSINFLLWKISQKSHWNLCHIHMHYTKKLSIYVVYRSYKCDQRQFTSSITTSHEVLPDLPALHLFLLIHNDIYTSCSYCDNDPTYRCLWRAGSFTSVHWEENIVFKVWSQWSNTLSILCEESLLYSVLGCIVAFKNIWQWSVGCGTENIYQ